MGADPRNLKGEGNIVPILVLIFMFYAEFVEAFLEKSVILDKKLQYNIYFYYSKAHIWHTSPERPIFSIFMRISRTNFLGSVPPHFSYGTATAHYPIT